MKLRKLVSDSDKVKILRLKAQGIKHEFIAKRFGLAVSTVSRVRASVGADDCRGETFRV